MTVASLLVWLTLLLSIVVGYRFFSWLYGNDPILAPLFGAALAVMILWAFQFVVFILGVLVITLPVAYIVLYILNWGTNTGAFSRLSTFSRETHQQQVEFIYRSLWSAAVYVSTWIRRITQRGYHRIRNGIDGFRNESTQTNRYLSSPEQERYVFCTYCGEYVGITGPPGECPECSHHLTQRQ